MRPEQRARSFVDPPRGHVSPVHESVLGVKYSGSALKSCLDEQMSQKRVADHGSTRIIDESS